MDIAVFPSQRSDDRNQEIKKTMKENQIVIFWFRQDLRLSDNPALIKAATQPRVLPVYILDDENAEDHAIGRASRWWLHHSLSSLDSALERKLNIYRGKAELILREIVKRHHATAVYWNRSTNRGV